MSDNLTLIVRGAGPTVRHQCDLPYRHGNEPVPMLSRGGQHLTSHLLVGDLVQCSCGQFWLCEQIGLYGVWNAVGARRARRIRRKVAQHC